MAIKRGKCMKHQESNEKTDSFFSKRQCSDCGLHEGCLLFLENDQSTISTVTVIDFMLCRWTGICCNFDRKQCTKYTGISSKWNTLFLLCNFQVSLYKYSFILKRRWLDRASADKTMDQLRFCLDSQRWQRHISQDCLHFYCKLFLEFGC